MMSPCHRQSLRRRRGRWQYGSAIRRAVFFLLSTAAAASFIIPHIWQEQEQYRPQRHAPISSPSYPRIYRRSSSGYLYGRMMVDDLAEETYDRSTHPPLIITIGPQCCGKSTILRRINETRPRNAPALLDIAIDNDREVYRRVSMDALLDDDGEGGGLLDDWNVLGRSVIDRCQDPAPLECRTVLRYYAGMITLNEAEAILASLPSTSEVLQDLISAMERSVDLGKGRLRAKAYRLFIPEAIPRAVRRSNALLLDAMKTYPGPVAWGNTNAKPSDFKGAIKAATTSGRRIVFFRWGQEFDTVPLQELLLRNIMRSTKIGRYVPAISIKRALERTNRLMSSSSDGDYGQLISMAGFTVDKEGRPRASLPPIDETPSIIRSFIGMTSTRRDDDGLGSSPWRKNDAGGEEGEILALDTSTWGRRVQYAERGGGGGGGGGGASGALVIDPAASMGIRRRSTERIRKWREALRRDARRLGEAYKWLRRFSLQAIFDIPTYYNMGKEWSKWKSWSRNAFEMDYEWRIQYQKARNQSLLEEEEARRNNNGTGNHTKQDFDWDRFLILRQIQSWGKM